MHLAARVDALNDLLADIASFAEVQCAILRGLLRQVALADIDAVAGATCEDTEAFIRFESRRLGARSSERQPKGGQIRNRSPDLKSGKRRIGANDGDAGFSQLRVADL